MSDDRKKRADLKSVLVKLEVIREKHKQYLKANPVRFQDAECEALRPRKFRLRMLQPEQIAVMRGWLDDCGYEGTITEDNRKILAKIVQRAIVPLENNSLSYAGDLGQAIIEGLDDAELSRLANETILFNRLADHSPVTQPPETDDGTLSIDENDTDSTVEQRDEPNGRDVHDAIDGSG